MRTRIELATILTLLFGVMILSCDVEDTPVEVQHDSAIAAAPAAAPAKSSDIEKLIEKAKIVDTKALGGAEVKLFKISDNISSASDWKKIYLVDQYAGSDMFTPVRIFAPADPMCLTMWFAIKEPGTVGCMFIWFGDETVIFAEGPDDLWWDILIPTPGEWGVGLDVSSFPVEPGYYFFMSAVRLGAGTMPWLRDWGFDTPDPYPFIIFTP